MMGIDCNMKIGSLCKRQQDFWSRWKWCGRNICNAEGSTDKWGTVKSHQWKDRKQETTVMLQRAVTDKQTILNALWENGWKSWISQPKKKKDPLKEHLMLGKTEGRRRRGWQKMRWLDASPTQWTWIWANSRRWWRTGKPGVLQSMGSQRVKESDFEWKTKGTPPKSQRWNERCSIILHTSFQ